MKNTLIALLALGFTLIQPAQARESQQQQAAQQVRQAEPSEGDLQTHKHYHNKDGQDVHSPAKSANGKVPAGASAKCRDSTYSFSKHRRGTCSGHGGVAVWH